MMRERFKQKLVSRAGEYVLGTMPESERARFERTLGKDTALQSEVARWNRVLSPMLELVKPVSPPRRVWRGVQSRIDRKAERAGIWGSLKFWRNLGMVAATVVLGLGLTLFSMQSEVRIERVMMVASPGSPQVEWVVGTDHRSDMLQVKAVAPPVLPRGQVCQLWVHVGDGKWKALGILPHAGTTKMPLPSGLDNNGQFKVTVEQLGSLPQASPSGRVIFTGELTKI